MEGRKRRWQAGEGSGRGREEGPKENGGEAAGGEGDIWRWRKGAAYIRCIDLYILEGLAHGASREGSSRARRGGEDERSRGELGSHT